MKAVANVLFFNAITLTLLYFGLNGVDGAYNIYAALIIIISMLSFTAWMDFNSQANAAIEKIKANAAKRRVSHALALCINTTSFFVLLWFGKFIIAAFMAMILLNMTVIKGKVDAIVKKAVDQQAV